MTEQSGRIPRPFIVFSLLVFAVGFAALVASWLLFPPTLDLRLVLILIGAALSELFLFSFPIYSMSLAYPLSMAAAVLSGPSSACLVSLVSTISLQDIRARRPIVFWLFNSGQLLLSTALGAWAYFSIAGRVLVVQVWRLRPAWRS